MTAPMIALLFFILAFSSFVMRVRLGAQTTGGVAGGIGQDFEAAKKEGKVTFSIPASAEMCKQVKQNFKSASASTWKSLRRAAAPECVAGLTSSHPGRLGAEFFAKFFFCAFESPGGFAWD